MRESEGKKGKNPFNDSNRPPSPIGRLSPIRSGVFFSLGISSTSVTGPIGRCCPILSAKICYVSRNLEWLQVRSGYVARSHRAFLSLLFFLVVVEFDSGPANRALWPDCIGRSQFQQFTFCVTSPIGRSCPMASGGSPISESSNFHGFLQLFTSPAHM